MKLMKSTSHMTDAQQTELKAFLSKKALTSTLRTTKASRPCFGPSPTRRGNQHVAARGEEVARWGRGDGRLRPVRRRGGSPAPRPETLDRLHTRRRSHSKGALRSLPRRREPGRQPGPDELGRHASGRRARGRKQPPRQRGSRARAAAECRLTRRRSRRPTSPSSPIGCERAPSTWRRAVRPLTGRTSRRWRRPFQRFATRAGSARRSTASCWRAFEAEGLAPSPEADRARSSAAFARSDRPAADARGSRRLRRRRSTASLREAGRPPARQPALRRADGAAAGSTPPAMPTATAFSRTATPGNGSGATGSCEALNDDLPFDQFTDLATGGRPAAESRRSTKRSPAASTATTCSTAKGARSRRSSGSSTCSTASTRRPPRGWG